MQTKNVYYSEKPADVIIHTSGKKAVVEIPVGVSEVRTEEGINWLAETVYSVATMNTPNLAERVRENYSTWIDIAKAREPEKTELQDVIDALNALTDLVLGGE